MRQNVNFNAVLHILNCSIGTTVLKTRRNSVSAVILSKSSSNKLAAEVKRKPTKITYSLTIIAAIEIKTWTSE